MVCKLFPEFFVDEKTVKSGNLNPKSRTLDENAAGGPLFSEIVKRSAFSRADTSHAVEYVTYMS